MMTRVNASPEKRALPNATAFLTSVENGCPRVEIRRVAVPLRDCSTYRTGSVKIADGSARRRSGSFPLLGRGMPRPLLEHSLRGASAGACAHLSPRRERPALLRSCAAIQFAPCLRGTAAHRIQRSEQQHNAKACDHVGHVLARRLAEARREMAVSRQGVCRFNNVLILKV